MTERRSLDRREQQRIIPISLNFILAGLEIGAPIRGLTKMRGERLICLTGNGLCRPFFGEPPQLLLG